jgi:hypothetical protein
MESRERELLKRSLRNSGWTEPIIIHATDLYIIDGEQRWTVADHPEVRTDEDLTPPDVPAGYVPVFGVELDGDDPVISRIQHNRARGEVRLSEMDEYVDRFDAEELAEIGLSEQEVFDLIDEDPTADIEEFNEDDADGTPPESEVDAIVADSDPEPMETVPDVPDPGELSIVCAPAERRFIEAVLPDGETIEAYLDAMEEGGLLKHFRDVAEST